jgi:hypothetical protein
MIAVYLYSRERVQQVLRDEYGCEFVAAVDERNDGYKTPWDHYFVVPALGEDGMCSKAVLYEVMAAIAKTKPADH